MEGPTITCSLSRKVNLGNFETADVYMAVTLPLDLADQKESVEEAVRRISAEQFKMLSSEVSGRYRYLKEIQAGSSSAKSFEEWREEKELQDN